jgi:5-methylcytosine-specific restriction endonuclease McrA
MSETSKTNPGQQLRELLKEIYPLNTEDINSSEGSSFVSRIDDGLIAGGNFTNLVYESSINYLLRRLINTSEYIRRKSELFSSENFVVELRRFLTEEIKIQTDKIEKILVLLKVCVEAKDKRLKSSRRKELIRNARENGEIRCYICGKSLENELENEREVSTKDKSYKQEKIEVEHIWPKTMGGATEDFNLKLSCSYCNQAKEDYIDATDFHYEQICHVRVDVSDVTEVLKREYKIAIWAKNSYSCSVCDKPAVTVGKLKFGRLNPNDSWHFLNIEAYCDEHAPE